MVTCPYCSSDDCAYEDSHELKTVVKYRFKVWVCNFFCRLCQTHFTIDLDNEDRREYL